MADEESPEDQPETITKEEADTMVQEALSKQEEAFDVKLEEVKEEMKPVEKTESNVLPKYVEDTWDPKTMNDYMTKTLEVVKEHHPTASKEEIKEMMVETMQEEQKKQQETAKAADSEWDQQVADIKKEEGLTDKQVSDVITKANEWNQQNPDSLITTMKVAHEIYGKGEKEEKKPTIPGAPTNAADEEPEQKIFQTSEEAAQDWLTNNT